MKKKLFGIAIVAMIAVAAAWNVNENKSEVTLSDIALDNVEALARRESGSDCITANCYWREQEWCEYTCNGILYSSSHMINKH
ncbi:NVEALA domain-containing protein [Parabacteroides bouchesdurhonensis]|uniref:NVEALA domain-containing protein n=1 Tax=Parabacteroides bouchesdurhonensis TaxID=1936995 RepID=UPI000C85C98A|nr:NVEALA domain-containing protein [Parabacteroides bouchesdurhonensis]